MLCCGGCCSSRAVDVEAPLPEVNVLEAGEKSLKLAIRLPRHGFFAAARRRKEEVQLSVVIFGGPDCDILGPKKDLIRCRCGSRVVHQVTDLLPDTRYTVQVSVEDDDPVESVPLRGSVPFSLEVRTAPASTCQFEAEDWGQTYFKKLNEDGDPKKSNKDLQTNTARSDNNRGRSHGGPSMSPQQPAVPRSVSGTDDSTIAPSDDGVDLQERNEEWDFTCEEVGRDRVVEDDPQVEEVLAVRQGTVCNLCSIMDCFKSMRSAPSVESVEIRFPAEHESSAEVVAMHPTASADAPPRPRRRPPFPGVAVDPASVGLELLPVLNESQLQHVFDSRSRATRAEN